MIHISMLNMLGFFAKFFIFTTLVKKNHLPLPLVDFEH